MKRGVIPYLLAGMLCSRHQYMNGTLAELAGGLHDSSMQVWERLEALLGEQQEGFLDLFHSPLEEEDGGRNVIKGQAAFMAQDLAAGAAVSNFFFPGDAETATDENCYIVQLTEEAERSVMPRMEALLVAAGAQVPRSFAVGDGVRGHKVCFAPGEIPLGFLQSLKWVAHVERDQKIGASQVQKGAPWGLAALGPFSNEFAFERTGKGVRVYLIDSGVVAKHPEFGGRASVGFQAHESDWLGPDCSGHGSEVASAAAGTNVGVAKEATVIVAAVLDCQGEGSNADLVAALDWLVKNFQAPGIVNMSVGGPRSLAVDAAISAAIARGIPIVVAAGNSAVDACTQSPSGVPSAIVVGASTQAAHMADFSNWGSCVDLFAPGEHVAVANAHGSGAQAYTFASGTSLAAPFVTGIGALLLEENPSLTPEALATKLKSMAHQGALKGNLRGSPNLIAQAPTLKAYPGPTIIDLRPPGYLPDGPAHWSLNSLAIILGLGAVLCAIAGGLTFLFVHCIRQRRIRQAEPTVVYVK